MHLIRRPILSLFILLLCLPACSPVNAVKIIKHDIVVAEFTADVSQSTATVEGQAQNTFLWPLDNCKICVTFYDYTGNSLGIFSDSIERLEPGQVWNFSAVLTGGDAWKVARYDISVCN
jgi:hypothetical protein